MKLPLLLAISVIILVSGCTTQLPSGGDPDVVQPDGTIVKPDGTMVKPDGTMVKPDGTMILPDGTVVPSEDDKGEQMDDGDSMQETSFTGEVIAGSTVPYLRYSDADFDKAREEGKAVYLYFYATWCPICNSERPKIFAAFDALTLDNAVGFEAHFSDGLETAEDIQLAKDYGVFTQHTHIFLDAQGSVVEKTFTVQSTNDIITKLTGAAA